MGNWKKRVCLNCLGLTPVSVSHLRNSVIMGPSCQWQGLGKLYSASFQIFHPVQQCLQIFHLDVFIIYSNFVPTLFWFRLWLFHAKSISDTGRMIQAGFFSGHVLMPGKPWAHTIASSEGNEYVVCFPWPPGPCGLSSAPLSKWLETA